MADNNQTLCWIIGAVVVIAIVWVLMQKPKHHDGFKSTKRSAIYAYDPRTSVASCMCAKLADDGMSPKYPQYCKHNSILSQ